MPADRVAMESIVAEMSAEEVAEILAREVARRNGRDFDLRRLMRFELVRETTESFDALSGVRVEIEWNGSAPSARPAPAIEAVGAEL